MKKTIASFKVLNLVYVLLTLAAFAGIWTTIGPFTAWMFCALACGLPQIVAAVKKD